MTALFIFIALAWAQQTEVYVGEATKDGKLIYTEKHTVEYESSGKVKSATTEYSNPEGKLIAILKSDFSKSLTAPEHYFQDFRVDHKHGIRRENDKVILFKSDKGQPEETKTVETEKKKDRVMFGCQGLHYYLKENMDAVNAKKELPILFMIPGSLDYYDFELEYKGEKDGLVDYDIEIDGFFLLKLVAPKLQIKYDKVNKRLTYYKGISNLLDDKGNNQKVTITYKY